MEDRILTLEREVGDLRVCNASLSVSVEHLAKNVEKLTTVAQDLTDIMNRGRGAIWVVGGVGTIFGAGITAWITHVLSR